MPIKNTDEANDMVKKVELYYNQDAFGDWRNTITFVADDGDAKDGNLHMNQANNLANYVDTNYKNININKIYLDNYLQESTPGGPRSPDAQNAINNSVNNGSFLINYTGHGGPLGWTQERILEVDQIRNWENQNKLPLFMTATCKFSCFDDIPQKLEEKLTAELTKLHEAGFVHRDLKLDNIMIEYIKDENDKLREEERQRRG